MFRHLCCAGHWLRILAFTCTVALAVSEPLWSASCVGPASLEARVHSHPDAETYSVLGIWFGAHHQSDCAVQAFQVGLKLEPNSHQLSYLLGLSFYTAGKLQEAVTPLQHSVELDPKDEKAHLLLASAFDGLGRSNEAFAEWQAALRINPNSKMALDGIAKTLLAAGDNETVIAQLSSMQLDESLTLDLAIAYGRAGQLENAASTLKRELETYPNSTSITSSLVSVYSKQLRLEEAEKAASQLALRNPHNIEAQRVYLQVLVFTGKNLAAVPLARKLLMQAPNDADFLYLNGVVERATGKLEDARMHLEKSEKLDPSRYSAYFNLGCTLEQLQEYEGARAQLQKAIELGPAESESRVELAKVLRRLGEIDAAQQQLEIYQKQMKDKSDHDMAAQKSTQAAEALRAGDKQKAAALYREAVAVRPDNAGLLYQFALVLGDINDTKGERAELEQAVTVDPAFALAQYQLGYLESRDGNMAGAEQCLRLAIKASPGYVKAWLALSATLAMESRIPDALQAVDSALKIAPDNNEALELRKSLVASQAQR
jgi:tetratricopeptide (TPR) repeat protein